MSQVRRCACALFFFINANAPLHTDLGQLVALLLDCRGATTSANNKPFALKKASLTLVQVDDAFARGQLLFSVPPSLM